MKEAAVMERDSVCLQSYSFFVTGKDNLLRNAAYALGHFSICVLLESFPELQIPTDLWDLRGILVHLFLLLAFLPPGAGVFFPIH